MKQFLITLTAMALVACGTQSKNINSEVLCDVNTDDINTTPVELNSRLGTPKIVPLSGEKPVGEINKIVQSKANIYILSNNDRLGKFNEKGESIFEIYKIGGAAGEYTYLWGFDVDDKYIYLCTGLNTILVYDNQNGAYQRTINLPFACKDVCVKGDKVVCLNNDAGALEVTIADAQGLILAQMGKTIINSRPQMPISFIKTEDGVIYLRPEMNDAMQIDLEDLSSKEISIIGDPKKERLLTQELYEQFVKDYGKVNQFGFIDVDQYTNPYYKIGSVGMSANKIIVGMYGNSKELVAVGVEGKASIDDKKNISSNVNGEALLNNFAYCSGDKNLVTFIQPSDVTDDTFRQQYSLNEESNPVIFLF